MASGNVFANGNGGDRVVLAPGFRFHPMDEELITHYLTPKVIDSNFTACAIVDVDLNKVEPWELPWKAKMGETEWYFFCMRDKKYPTGLRTNRATAAGYWKATGKDKEILRGEFLVGMKKTLVFYKGRAPRGEKTNWIMHEFRLDGEHSLQNLPKTARNEWVISKVFEKTSGGKKVHVCEVMHSTITDLTTLSGISMHVPCFSNLACIHGQGMCSYSNINMIPNMNPPPNLFHTPFPVPTWPNGQYPYPGLPPFDQSYLMNFDNVQENTNYIGENEMENGDEISPPVIPDNSEMINYMGQFGDDDFEWTNGF